MRTEKRTRTPVRADKQLEEVLAAVGNDRATLVALIGLMHRLIARRQERISRRKSARGSTFTKHRLTN